MSENGEKQFDPTPARLAKARRDGDIARAQELNANISLLAAMLALAGIVPVLGTCARKAAIDASSGSLTAACSDCALALACALIPMGANAIASLATGIAQSSGLTFAPLSLKFERIDPFAGLKRMCSLQTLAQCARATIACAVSLSIIIVALMPLVAVTMREGSIPALVESAWNASVRTIVIAGTVGIGFAVIEYAAARNAWLKRLRMTFDEYKRSIKEQDGDPQVRGRRRSLHRALSREDVRNVEKAAFVVCNPTHIAIALAYDPPAEPVPRVLVRAADVVAQHVRAIATEHNVPLVENAVLARALYAEAKTGLTIPHDHYLAVAEIVVALTRERKLRS